LLIGVDLAGDVALVDAEQLRHLPLGLLVTQRRPRRSTSCSPRVTNHSWARPEVLVPVGFGVLGQLPSAPVMSSSGRETSPRSLRRSERTLFWKTQMSQAPGGLCPSSGRGWGGSLALAGEEIAPEVVDHLVLALRIAREQPNRRDRRASTSRESVRLAGV